jgi:gliding motility-associated-like protein
VPNAFTPNNDGKNDVFRAITDGDCWLFWDMKVYNRWGDLVWETDTPGAQWLGNNTVGVFAHSVSDGLYYVPDGVYYWKLRGQKRGDVWIEMNGHVNLIR